MFGPDGGNVRYFHSVDSRGIVPRIAEAVFDCPNVTSVELSYFELYNENVTDLVAKMMHLPEAASSTTVLNCVAGPSSRPQVLYRSTEKGKLRRSLCKTRCQTGQECLQVIGELSAIRHVASTEHNFKSSRSHVIIQLWISTRSNQAGRRCGELTLVDLAGSESLKTHPCMPIGGNALCGGFDALSATRLQASRQMQQRANEMRHINASLFALKKVVHALTRRCDHIPFKDSILTVVLEDCLQSPSTSMVICCSQEHRDISETFASLRLGAEASTIVAPAAVVHRQQFISRVKEPTHADACRAVDVSSDGVEFDSESTDDPHVVAPYDDIPKPTLDRPDICLRSVSEMLAAAGASASAEADVPRSRSQLLHADELQAENHALRRELDEIREKSKLLMRQCAKLASAYDEAVEEIDAARQREAAAKKEAEGLRLELIMARNTRRLEMVAEGAKASETFALCVERPNDGPQDITPVPFGFDECGGRRVPTPKSPRVILTDSTNVETQDAVQKRRRVPMVKVF
jgi:hypothetical protein